MKKILLVGLLSSVSSLALAADLPQLCQDYFEALDTYATTMAADANMATEATALKAQFNDAKEQLQALPVDQQEMACKMAIDAMQPVAQPAE